MANLNDLRVIVFGAPEGFEFRPSGKRWFDRTSCKRPQIDPVTHPLRPQDPFQSGSEGKQYPELQSHKARRRRPGYEEV
jgi:hypothetical protein